ncbi:MAG: hypothetical protein KDK71_08655, partial [Chlamydiia bacterium]|nr:hypothetical protein [Chlamydiia bacterium]
LIDLLDIQKAVVTIDAAGCQKEIASKMYCAVNFRELTRLTFEIFWDSNLFGFSAPKSRSPSLL